MKFQNNKKSPNKLHDFLIGNNCTPSYLGHNAEYDEFGVKSNEATEIYIEIESEKEQQLTNLVNQFMTQYDTIGH